MTPISGTCLLRPKVFDRKPAMPVMFSPASSASSRSCQITAAGGCYRAQDHLWARGMGSSVPLCDLKYEAPFGRPFVMEL